MLGKLKQQVHLCSLVLVLHVELSLLEALLYFARPVGSNHQLIFAHKTRTDDCGLSWNEMEGCSPARDGLGRALPGRFAVTPVEPSLQGSVALNQPGHSTDLG